MGSIHRHRNADGRRAATMCLLLILLAALASCSREGERDGSATSAETVAAQVRACMTQHGLTTAHEVSRVQGQLKRLSACDWPPPGWAQADGFHVITIDYTDGPGESEASGRNSAWRIRSPCQRLRVTVSYGSQGYSETFPPFDAAPGQLLSARGKTFGSEESSLKRDLSFYPGSDELVVLSNGKHMPENVACVQ